MRLTFALSSRSRAPRAFAPGSHRPPGCRPEERESRDGHRASVVADRAGRGDRVELVRVVEHGRLRGAGRARVVVASDGVQELRRRAELLHAVATHHDRQAARTAEAAVLYHANQLDAQAATRPVGE